MNGMNDAPEHTEPPRRRSSAHGAEKPTAGSRRSRAHSGARRSDSRRSDDRPAGILGLATDFATATLSIGSGMRVSAVSVLVFSAASILLWLLPGSAWTYGPVVGFAGICLALGWNALTGIELPVPTTVLLALAGAVIPAVVAYTGDFADAVPLVGLAVIGVAATTLATAPSPRDRSVVPPEEDTAPASSPVPRRRKGEDPAMPTSLVLASALSALALIVGGTAWVALDVLTQWAIVVPIACVVVAAVVWGDQIGSSYRSQSLGALGAGVAAGLVAAVAVWWLGRTTSLMPIVLPGLADAVGKLGAVCILGVASGLAVAVAVIVLDGLLGDHLVRRPPLGALARGAAKFLIAAIPVYAMIRIGGI